MTNLAMPKNTMNPHPVSTEQLKSNIQNELKKIEHNKMVKNVEKNLKAKLGHLDQQVHHSQPQNLDVNVNDILNGSFGTAMAAMQGAQIATQGGMDGDGRKIAEGVLTGVAGMAPEIQKIVNGAMGEELH